MQKRSHRSTILNCTVAYQALHRSAKVKAGEKALIIGASGGKCGVGEPRIILKETGKCGRY